MKIKISLLLLSIFSCLSFAQAADLANGKAINKNCALCHGQYDQGASGKLSPRLAGLPKEYLVKALNDYRDGTRSNYMMIKTSALDKISDKDIDDIATYLSIIDLKADASFDIVQHTGDPESGKETFKGDCKSCHAKDGFGKPRKEAPPLAGQHHEYLFQSIKMFQAKARLHDNDAEDEMFDDLSDKDILDTTAYISTLDNTKIDKSGKSKLIAPEVVAKRAFPTVAVAPSTVKKDSKLAVADPKKRKMESHGGGLKINDITQTVAQMSLEEGVNREDAVEAMLSKAADLNMKLVGQQHVSKELESRGVDTPYLAIFQFCDPMDARTMIMNNPVFATYMPCRISLVEDQNKKLWLMMLNLDVLINSKTQDQSVVDTAIRVNQSMLEIMVAGATGEF